MHRQAKMSDASGPKIELFVKVSVGKVLEPEGGQNPGRHRALAAFPGCRTFQCWDVGPSNLVFFWLFLRLGAFEAVKWDRHGNLRQDRLGHDATDVIHKRANEADKVKALRYVVKAQEAFPGS